MVNNMLSNEKTLKWLLENRLDEHGNIDLRGIDFGDITVDNSQQKAKKIFNGYQKATKIYNYSQQADGIYNYRQEATKINNYYQQATEINNDNQEADEISNRNQKVEEIDDSEQITQMNYENLLREDINTQVNIDEIARLKKMIEEQHEIMLAIIRGISK